jgi:hypothetical protein
MDDKKVWVLVARAHRYFPHLNVGSYLLVPEDQVDAVVRRSLMADEFFREDRKGCTCHA